LGSGDLKRDDDADRKAKNAEVDEDVRNSESENGDLLVDAVTLN
jgi:hypothetical protein